MLSNSKLLDQHQKSLLALLPLSIDKRFIQIPYLYRILSLTNLKVSKQSFSKLKLS